MQRREFIGLLSGAAANWPLLARAQQPPAPTIGFVRSTDAASSARFVEAFRAGLNERSFLEGRNVAIEFRWAEGRTDRLPVLIADLIQRHVAVILAGGSEASAASKAATATIPIVFATGEDPVKLGLVSSLSRPGGNATGVFFINSDLAVKSLDLLHYMTPKLSKIALLVYSNSPGAEAVIKDVQAAAQALGRVVIVLKVTGKDDIAPAFTGAIEQRAGALVVIGNAMMTANLTLVAALAARHALPAVYSSREYLAAGGLMSYGTNVADAFRQAGVYTGRVLSGEKPADIPVQLSTKFELVINLKVAKTLGVTIPESILATADEVIE